MHLTWWPIAKSQYISGIIALKIAYNHPRGDSTARTHLPANVFILQAKNVCLVSFNFLLISVFLFSVFSPDEVADEVSDRRITEGHFHV